MDHFIETQRLFIDVPTLEDVDYWHTLHSDPEVMKYLGGVRDRSTILQWLENDILHYEKHGFCLGSVVEKDSKTFIGRAGLVYLNYDETRQDIEIGFELKKNFWNKGYAVELVQAVIKWGFNRLKVPRLVAVTKPENRKSQYVMEKAKMEYEGKIQFHDTDYLFYVTYEQR